MNPVWAEFKSTSQEVGKWINRRAMRDLLRAEPDLSQVRKAVFGQWRKR